MLVRPGDDAVWTKHATRTIVVAMPTAVIYARRSGGRNDSTSLSTQEQECTRFLAAKGYTVVKVCRDARKSGGKGADTRPGYKEFLRICADREVDAAAIWTTDRSTREGIEELATLARALGRDDVKPVRFFVVGEGIDTGTSETAWLQLSIMAEIARTDGDLPTMEVDVRVMPSSADAVARDLENVQSEIQHAVENQDFDAVGELNSRAQELKAKLAVEIQKPVDVRHVMRNETVREVYEQRKDSPELVAQLLQGWMSEVVITREPRGGSAADKTMITWQFEVD